MLIFDSPNFQLKNIPTSQLELEANVLYTSMQIRSDQTYFFFCELREINNGDVLKYQLSL